MARARLFSPLGVVAGVSVDVDDEATVGRDRGHAVVIDDGLISKDHARIAFDSATGGFLLEDLGSTNGTALDGVPVVGRERLDHLHVITFAGRHEFVFQDLARTRVRHGSSPAPKVARGADGTPITEPIEVAQAHEPLAVPQVLIDRMDASGDHEPEGAEQPGSVERTQFHELPLAVPSGIRQAESLVPEAPEAAALGVAAPPAVSPEGVPPAVSPEGVPPAVSPEGVPPAVSPEGVPPAVSPEGVPPAVSPEGVPPAVSPEGVPPLPGSPTAFVLEVDFESGSERFSLVYGSNQIGRTATAAVRLTSDHVSRRHAVMKIGKTITLRDQGSNNHTYLAGVEIASEIEIEPGDALAFGPLEARVLRIDSAGNKPVLGGSDDLR